MYITNNHELKEAYALLKISLDWFSTTGMTKEPEYIVELKQRIRAYTQETSCETIIRSDYDGYVELIEFPEDIEGYGDAEEFFEYNYRRQCRPSQYDCTGQLFTWRHKIFKRRGRFFAYHFVGVDC